MSYRRQNFVRQVVDGGHRGDAGEAKRSDVGPSVGSLLVRVGEERGREEKLGDDGNGMMMIDDDE